MDPMMMMLMLRGGGGLNPETLRASIQKSNEKRRKIFKKVADLLFGLVMLIWGNLSISVTNSSGQTVGANDPSLSTNDKLNAIIQGLQQSSNNTILREFLRPLLVDAAEFIAEMMNPDENMVAMLAGTFQGGGVPGGVHVYNGVPALPGAPGMPGAPSVASPYEGRAIQANDGDPTIYKVENGMKRGFPTVGSFLKAGFVSGQELKLPRAIIDSIPTGAIMPQ